MDVVIAQCPAVFELFTGEDEALLVGWDALFILNLRLDIINGVTIIRNSRLGFIPRLDFKCDGFAGEGLDKDLHTPPQTED